MYKLNQDQKRLPFGGHHFYDKGFMIKGETVKEVVGKITDYRLNNNRPIGNPEQEVLEYYALNFPWMVKKDNEEVPKENESYALWRKWVQKTWTNPPKKLITTKEASFRWDVCKKCPHNKPINWPESDESTQITRKAFLLRQGMEIPEELGFCSLHNVDIGVLTFIETPKDYSEQKKDTPGYPSCWV